MSEDAGKKKSTIYFGEEEEAAVVRYLNAETFEEKNLIYQEYLKEPFNKMISSIIRRYKLHRKGYSFDEVFNDTESFLITKMDMFDPSRNFKAYSYYGTTCRNYLKGLLTKDSKEKTKKISYDDFPKIIEDNENVKHYDSDYIEKEKLIIDKLLERIRIIEENEILTLNEQKLTYALIEIFSNYETLFNDSIKNNNKLNKSLILLIIKDLTNLNLKEIRVSMKKFKDIHKEIVKEINNFH